MINFFVLHNRQAAGNKKLEVVKRAAKFKMRIQKAEWENQKLKMRIEDLKEDIYYLDHFKVNDFFFIFCTYTPSPTNTWSQKTRLVYLFINISYI